jgi:hypothetical protein
MPVKTYEVAGVCPVYGHKPGERAQLDLTPEQEAMYLQGGHLREVSPAGSDLHKLSRGELNGLAAQLGIKGADQLPNKTAVVEAIVEKG